MADSEIRELTADTSPTSDDIVYVQGDPAGTPVDRKVTLENLLKVVDDLTELAVRPAQSDTLLVLDNGAAKYVEKRNLQVRYVSLPVGSTGTDLATGDRQAWIKIPADIAGLDLVSVEADVVTAPTGAALSIQVRNVTQAANILSTALTIDATETSSDTAATPPVIDTSEDDMTDGDIIAIDIDQVGSSEPGENLLVTLGLA